MRPNRRSRRRGPTPRRGQPLSTSHHSRARTHRLHPKAALSLREVGGGTPRTPYREDVATVLVIEDDQHIREALARGLADAGHAVRTEATGAAGLTAAVEWTPDVVVLDLGLPDLDGGTVLGM